MKTLRIILGDLKTIVLNFAEVVVVLWCVCWVGSVGGIPIVVGAFAETESTLIRAAAAIFCGAGWLVVFFFMIRGIVDYVRGLSERAKS